CDQAPVEEPRPAAVVEQVADVRIAVYQRRRTFEPEVRELDVVVDVELGDVGELVTEAIAVVVEAELQQRGPVGVAGSAAGDPTGVGGARALVLEADVELGQVL